MGRYSRKDMIEFAKFAKSYQSSRSVEAAYEMYLRGQRIATRNTSPSWYFLFIGADKVYVDGKLVKNRHPSKEELHGFNIHDNKTRRKKWDKNKRILHLTTIQ